MNNRKKKERLKKMKGQTVFVVVAVCAAEKGEQNEVEVLFVTDCD